MMHAHEWQSLARRLAAAGLCIVACVGQPPSPPQGSSSTSSGTPGDATTAAVETGGTTHPLQPTTTTGDGTTQGASPGTSTGEPSTTDPLSTTTAFGTTDGGSSTTGPSQVCDLMYGSVPDYILCEETATSCSFSVWLDGMSCDTLCGAFGSVCLEALNNGGSSSCAVFGPGGVPCADVAEYRVCVCSN